MGLESIPTAGYVLLYLLGGADFLARRNRAELRYETLVRLEEFIGLLVGRYGARMTLGELWTITTGLRMLCKKEWVTVAEIAEATGLPKQNISRWIQKRLGDSIRLRTNDDDQRMKDLVLADPMRAQAFIEELAATLERKVRKKIDGREKR